MKKLLVTLLLLFASAMCIVGAGYKTPARTITFSSTFLGGDSTNAVYTDTFYYQLPEDFSGFRFIKTFFQSTVLDSAAIQKCTTFVDVQTGIGESPGGLWSNVVTYKITDESTFTTSGYDLIKVFSTDSVLPNIRLRFRMQTDSTGAAPLTDFIDSVYNITATFEVIVRD